MKQERNVRGRGGVYPLAVTAVMTAVLCVLAPFALPIGPVPISLTNLILYLSIYILGWRRTTMSYVVYLLIGAVGVPVFSGWTGGLGKIMGPTGGYLAGFLPMVVIAGVAIALSQRRWVQFAGMALGTGVCYVLGTAWFCYVMGASVASALGLCVIPFLPGDVVKILVAMVMGPVIRARLDRAGLALE